MKVKALFLIGLLWLISAQVFAASNTIFSQTLEANPDTGDELMIDKALDGPTRKITIGSIISGQTEVTAVGADFIAIIDVTDSELRKATLSDILISPTVIDSLTITGSAPVLSACGTSPTVIGARSAGKITIGTSTTTSCTVTFATAFSGAPACIVMGDSTAIRYATTTTTTVMTLTSSGDMDSDVISYMCIGL